MTEKDFLDCVAELVEAAPEKISMSCVITEIENFDSITFLGLISFADTQGITVSPDDFLNVTTLQDVFEKINQRR